MLDHEARRAVIALLARGLVTPIEAARLAGVSRQLMRHWIMRAGVDWDRIRSRRLAKAFREEMRRGPKLVDRARREAPKA